MIYNFANEFDIQKHDIHIERAKRLKKKVRSETISEKRSLSINAYLHVLINYFAVEYGERKDKVKEEFYKIKCNSDIYLTKYENKKQGYIRDDLRSSSDLTNKEMALSIERFRDYASEEAGIYLPPADNKEFLAHCMNEIEKHKQYI